MTGLHCGACVRACVRAESSCPQYDGYTFTPYKDLAQYDFTDVSSLTASAGSVALASYRAFNACLANPECKSFTLFQSSATGKPGSVLKYFAPRPDKLAALPDTFAGQECAGIYTEATGACGAARHCPCMHICICTRSAQHAPYPPGKHCRQWRRHAARPSLWLPVPHAQHRAPATSASV